MRNDGPAVRDTIRYQGQDWRLEQTGGNCTAYTRPAKRGGYHLLTMADAPVAPEPGADVCVASYHYGDGEPRSTATETGWAPDCDGCSERHQHDRPVRAYRVARADFPASLTFYCDACQGVAVQEGFAVEPWTDGNAPRCDEATDAGDEDAARLLRLLVEAARPFTEPDRELEITQAGYIILRVTPADMDDLRLAIMEAEARQAVTP